MDAVTVTNGAARIYGTLTFGAESSVVVVGDIDAVPRRGGYFLLAKAVSVSGLPNFKLDGWRVAVSGGELRLLKPGFLLFVR